MHQTTLDGIDRGLGTVVNAHLIEDAADVDAHGFLSDVQLLGDIAIACPPSDTGENLTLTGGQLNQAGAPCQPVASDRREIAHSPMNSNNGLYQLFSARILGEISHGAVADGAINVFAALVV